MTIYRIRKDALGYLKGSCISEQKYKSLFYLNRCLFEPITEEDTLDMINVKDDEYCHEKGLESLYFYSEKEVLDFLTKQKCCTY